VHRQLPSMDRGPRLDRIRGAMDDAGVDALLVTKLVNLRWLTGFTGSSGMLLVLSDGLVFVTDGRYREQSAAELGEAGVEADQVITTTPGETFRLACSGRGVHRVGAEADHLTWAASTTARREWFSGLELVPTSGLVESLREFKDSGEVARTEAAAQIADAALGGVLPSLADGPTEIEVAVLLESAMRRMGAEEPAFATIVAAGANGALPHHHPSERRIGSGDLVVIDMGATVDGYRSDMTRTIAVGDIDETLQRVLRVVGEAQSAGVAAVAHGVACKDVDAAARSVIEAAGWGEEFVHPTGHGVGLEIHEPLRLAATSAATLAAGHVVTVEPGVYLPGVGGARIEDTVEVTASGCRRLTSSPLSLAVG
jgi:Xaa-Pro aminopeptidase